MLRYSLTYTAIVGGKNLSFDPLPKQKTLSPLSWYLSPSRLSFRPEIRYHPPPLPRTLCLGVECNTSSGFAEISKVFFFFLSSPNWRVHFFFSFSEQLTSQLQAKTEEGQTALTIATRAGHVSTWRAVASKMTSSAEVRTGTCERMGLEQKQKQKTKTRCGKKQETYYYVLPSQKHVRCVCMMSELR